MESLLLSLWLLLLLLSKIIFSLLLRWEGVKAKIFSNIDVNRVLDVETQFTGGRHVEIVPTHTRLEHENRPLKTRFIIQNRAS